MSIVSEVTVRMVTEQCCVCGMPFCMTEDFKTRHKRNGEDFYCPAGHPQHYTETEVQQLQRQIAARDKELEARTKALIAEKALHDQTIAELRETELKRRAAKGQATKLKNRIIAGTCPCCELSFPNLHKHMEVEHPDFVPEEIEAIAKALPPASSQGE